MWRKHNLIQKLTPILETNNSHDSLFRYATNEVREIKIYLKKYFPKELFPLLDLNSLKKADTSYIDEELEAFYSDAIYGCKIKGNRATKIYVSLLFEHKSYIPKFPHLQLLQYVLNGLNQQVKEKQKKLTLILPFVIAHAN